HEIAAKRAPHMIVRIDQTRHDDHVGGVDDFDALGLDTIGDLLDAAIAYQHVGAGQRSDSAVNRDDGTAADEIAALWLLDDIGHRSILMNECPRLVAAGGNARSGAEAARPCQTAGTVAGEPISGSRS